MAKESKGYYGWPILGIVAIVAVVGLVMMFTQKTATVASTEEAALAGEAVKMGWVTQDKVYTKAYVNDNFYTKDYIKDRAANAVIKISKAGEKNCVATCSIAGKNTFGFGFVKNGGSTINVIAASETAPAGTSCVCG